MVAFGFITLLTLVSWPHRQAAAETTLDQEARALFEAGDLAFRDGRPADARHLFQRSLELSPRPGTAWNLALALRAINELVLATELLTELLEGRYGELDRVERAETEALLQELTGRIAVLRISAQAPTTVDVTIDGEPSGSLDPGDHLERWVTSGQHVIRGVAEGAEPDEQTITVVSEEVHEVTLSLSSSLGNEGTRQRSIAREPWFWTVIVSFVAVAVTAGVLAWWFVDGRQNPGPEVDPIWGNTEALRWTDRP